MADRESGKAKLRSSRLDFASFGGVLVAIAALLGGLIMDGGKVSDITQVTAAIIVLGGTLGAVLTGGHVPPAVTNLNLPSLGRLPATNRLHLAIHRCARTK